MLRGYCTGEARGMRVLRGYCTGEARGMRVLRGYCTHTRGYVLQ